MPGSSTIRASNPNSATRSYRSSQTRLLGSHLPPARFTRCRISTSDNPTRTITRVSPALRRAFGCQSVSSMINSTVLIRFFRCTSYRYRTQTSRSPYWVSSLLVPRWPGLRVSRVRMIVKSVSLIKHIHKRKGRHGRPSQRMATLRGPAVRGLRGTSGGCVDRHGRWKVAQRTQLWYPPPTGSPV